MSQCQWQCCQPVFRHWPCWQLMECFDGLLGSQDVHQHGLECLTHHMQGRHRRSPQEAADDAEWLPVCCMLQSCIPWTVAGLGQDSWQDQLQLVYVSLPHLCSADFPCFQASDEGILVSCRQHRLLLKGAALTWQAVLTLQSDQRLGLPGCSAANSGPSSLRFRSTACT